LKVLTYNVNNLLVENPQSSPAPVLQEVNESNTKHGIFFLENFHLQFPLDNLEDHSYILIQFFENINPNAQNNTAAPVPVTPASTGKAGSKAGVASPTGTTGGNSEVNPDHVMKAWGKFSLDRMSITSETIHFPMFLPPVTTNSPKPFGTLDMEVIITKR
jgi:hypothetical protein